MLYLALQFAKLLLAVVKLLGELVVLFLIDWAARAICGSLKTEGFNGVKTEKLPDVLQGLPDLLGFLRERVGLVFAKDALQVLLRRVAQLAATEHQVHADGGITFYGKVAEMGHGAAQDVGQGIVVQDKRAAWGLLRGV